MKLYQMTWADVQQEMSLAGSAAKFTDLGKKIEDILMPAIDGTNRAELTNAEIMLRRLLAEIKLLQRRHHTRQNV